jgi:uncharacterized protein YjbI with pentapeptide repeats
MVTQSIEKNQEITKEAFLLIKDEELASTVISSQILASSRVLRSTYRQVVFSECVFYACEFQGVIFDNCVFENCSFEFSQIRNCKFINCNFSNCEWTAVETTKSIYEACELDLFLMEATGSFELQAVTEERDQHTTDIYYPEMLAA